VSSNFPIEEDVFHLRTFANVMNNHVAPAPPVLLIDHDAYVRYASAQVPGDEVARRIIFAAVGDGQCFALALEKDHQIRNAAMVDIRVGMDEKPAPLVGVRGEIMHMSSWTSFCKSTPTAR
jgi:hypothetical protein